MSTPENSKQKAELTFWQQWLDEHGTGARSAYYQNFMMRMGGVEDFHFFDDLICLDVGCGPMGSMTWLTNARAAIGLDPLADDYMQFSIDHHDMIYLNSPAEQIPLPTHYVDVVFSMNSLDHVDDLAAACLEIRRILKPGGYFIGSLNLDEAPTPAEPWTLTEELLGRILFEGWTRQFYEVRPKLEDGGDPYRLFEEPAAETPEEGPKALWCRFQVPHPSK